jgi:hypothetical protein
MSNIKNYGFEILAGAYCALMLFTAYLMMVV